MIAMLFEASIRALFVAAAIGLVLITLRVRAGAVRHAAWTAVLAAMLLMPVLPSLVPAIPVPISTAAPRAVAGIDPLAQYASAPVARMSSLASAQPAPREQSPLTSASGSQPASTGWAWSAAALGLWATGAIAFVCRLVFGWRVATRLAARSRLIVASDAEATGTSPVYESELVATPVTVGVFAPRIILPAAWARWPAEHLRAVLVHERAHLARRDAIVGLVAHVNRCVFWFHPLAWWLERRLAATAEQACDDEAVKALGQARPYAAVLVNMAAAVRLRRGLVAWQGVGIGGNGRLTERIDRVLRGDVWFTMSPTRKVGVAVAWGAAIVLGIACQRQAAALVADPEVTARLAQQKADSAVFEAARQMTVEQVAALEASVAGNPDDLEATKKLLIFYRESGQKVLGWNQMIAARRPHMLRVIERHPESELSQWPLLTRVTDPAGYAQARSLWLAQVEKPGVTSRVLGNAAGFFRVSEKPLAEQLLLRAQAIDPSGPQPRMANGIYHMPWVARLGTLYAQAILGSNDETIFNVPKSLSGEEARGPYATAIRKQLEASSDPALLLATGNYLVSNASQTKVDFDHVALGRSYLERAVQLDPNSVNAQRQLMALNVRDRLARIRAALKGPIGQADVATVSALSEADRFESLPWLAEEAYMHAEGAEYYRKDKAQFEQSLERARRFAEEALALAQKYRDHRHYGTAVYRAHITLGAVALRRGDRAAAVRHMRQAAQSPGSAELAEYQDSLLRSRLTNSLLTAGERDSVAEFLERASEIARSQKGQLLAEAKAIREGRMPQSYQYAMTPR